MAFFKKAQEAIHKFDSTYDVDTTDRFKYTYSPWLLCGTAFLTFTKNYVGQSVQCWVPNQFSGAWESYAETYCLIEGTYHVPMNSTNLPPIHQRESMEMRYYQWVPFILALQAFFLYIPRLLWKQLQNHWHMNLSEVTMSTRKNAKKEICNDFKCEVDAKRAKDNWKLGYKLTLTLIGTKVFSLILLAVQTVVMEWFLSGKAFSFFGVTVVADLIRGRMWQQSGNFPRVAFCDIEVREMGIVQRWSLQCVLMVNMFNEKIFIFFWWYFVVLMIISSINLIKWLLRLLPGQQDAYIKRVVGFAVDDPKLDVSQFRRDVLKTDGVTILHLVEENSTLYQAAVFLEPLWDVRQSEVDKKKKQ